MSLQTEVLEGKCGGVIDMLREVEGLAYGVKKLKLDDGSQAELWIRPEKLFEKA